jgi:hypothetical protein
MDSLSGFSCNIKMYLQCRKAGAWREALGHRKECYSCRTGRSTAGGEERGEN